MLFLRKLARLLCGCLAALGLLMLLVSLTPAVAWYTRALAKPWDDAKGEVLIVLGGGMIDKDMLAAGSYWRAVYAYRAWRMGGFREIVVSGSGVAPLMQDFLVSHGVPSSAIRVENASHSTRENALYTKKLLEGVPGRKVLLTSDFHTYRASRVFAKAGLPVRTRPFPDAIKLANHLDGRWNAFLGVSQETGKIVYYWLRGWI